MAYAGGTEQHRGDEFGQPLALEVLLDQHTGRRGSRPRLGTICPSSASRTRSSSWSAMFRVSVGVGEGGVAASPTLPCRGW